jgi:hypothetical protein
VPGHGLADNRAWSRTRRDLKEVWFHERAL